MKIRPKETIYDEKCKRKGESLRANASKFLLF